MCCAHLVSRDAWKRSVGRRLLRSGSQYPRRCFIRSIRGRQELAAIPCLHLVERTSTIGIRRKFEAESPIPRGLPSHRGPWANVGSNTDLAGQFLKGNLIGSDAGWCNWTCSCVHSGGVRQRSIVVLVGQGGASRAPAIRVRWTLLAPGKSRTPPQAEIGRALRRPCWIALAVDD